MTIRSSAMQNSGRPGYRLAYRVVFTNHVHRILAAGYFALSPSELKDKEETDITGLLVKAMQSKLEEPDAPKDLSRYSVHEDPPVNFRQLEGKRRPRVDIEIEYVCRSSRPRFSFEAKRLYNNAGLSEYLGVNGMGRFLSGRYATNHDDAGMLAYVQSATTQEWAERVRGRVKEAPRKYKLDSGPYWEKRALPTELDQSYKTSHSRSQRPFTIHHTFLQCS